MKGEQDTLPAMPHIPIAITCRIVDGLHNLCMGKATAAANMLRIGLITATIALVNPELLNELG